MKNEGSNLQCPERLAGWRAFLVGVVMALVVCLVVVLLVLAARQADAQQYNGYHRVTFTNPALPTPNAPFLVYTNNGTNSGFSAPVTQTMTNFNFNPLTVWNTTNMTPVYIGNDWLPSVPITLILGLYAPNPPSGVTNCAATNYLAYSPDGNYWTQSNSFPYGATFSSGQTNWYYFYLGNGGGQTNMAYASWVGCFSTNSLYVVYWGYQFPK